MIELYWGKKIVEWPRTPEEALAAMLYLNDKYALDALQVAWPGPNSYANTLWCFELGASAWALRSGRFGRHGRPWGERIFGMARYMARCILRGRVDRKITCRLMGTRSTAGNAPARN
jgi:deoxyribodipyrimidine photo-lyase